MKEDTYVFVAGVLLFIAIIAGIQLGSYIFYYQDNNFRICVNDLEHNYQINSSITHLDGSVEWRLMSDVDRAVYECTGKRGNAK